MDRNRLDAYILQNYSYLTLSQMAEDLDILPAKVYAACGRLKVTPIRGTEQQKIFIMDHKHWSRERLGKALNINDRGVVDLCNELGISISAEVKVMPSKTISQRLRETWL